MPGPRARLTVAVAFFAYVVLVRTHDIAGTFLLLGEQTRDWTLALGGWRDLPLTGTPSTAGGRGFGPIYYWVLWLGRHLVGPFTDNLPHAGGITVSLLQASADTWLFVALWRRLAGTKVPALRGSRLAGTEVPGLRASRLSLPLALAIALVVASQPFDVGLSAAIWNPPVATALVKMTMALVLGLGESPSLWKVAGTAAVAWLGVQAHSSAAFVAAPVLALLVAQPLLARQWRRPRGAGRGVGAGGVGLQLPYVAAQFLAPASNIGPTVVIDSLAHAATVNPLESFNRISSIAGWLITRGPDSWPYGIVTAAAAAAAAWRWWRDPAMLAVSVGPLVTATLLFSTWTRPYDSYWFMTLAPAIVVTAGLAVTALPRAEWVTRAGWVCLALAVAWQPARIEQSKGFFRYPEYRPLLDGSRTAFRRSPVLQDLRVAFEVHPTTDVQYLYRILGGRIDESGGYTAEIQRDGTVTFAPVP